MINFSSLSLLRKECVSFQTKNATRFKPKKSEETFKINRKPGIFSHFLISKFSNFFPFQNHKKFAPGPGFNRIMCRCKGTEMKIRLEISTVFSGAASKRRTSLFKFRIEK